MKNLIFNFYLVFLLSFLVSIDAKACEVSSNAYKTIAENELIFKGLVKDTRSNFLNVWLDFIFQGPEFTAEIRVIEQFKGDADKISSVSYSKNFAQSLEINKQYLFFIQKQQDTEDQLVGDCDQVIDLEERADDETLKTFFRISKNKNYIESNLRKTYAKQKALAVELYSKFPSPESALEQKKKLLHQCSSNRDISFPEFLQDFPEPVPSNHYKSESNFLKKYAALALVFGELDIYERSVCLLGSSLEPAHFLKAISKLSKGDYIRDQNEFLTSKNDEFDYLSLAGLDIGSVKFTNTSIGYLYANNANLSGSSFIATKIFDAHAHDLKLIDAKFQKSKFSGDFESADFTNANFQFADFSGTSLKNAILKNADLRYAKMNLKSAEDIKGAVLEGAIYNENTVWPTGFIPAQHGAQNEAVNRAPITSLDVFASSNGRSVTIPISGSYYADGVQIKNADKVILKNSQPNTIYVYSPGLTENNNPYKSLRILGDKGLDRVVLDGCSGWYLPYKNSATNYTDPKTQKTEAIPAYIYKPSPESGKQHQIWIEKGLLVSFSRNCNSPNYNPQQSKARATEQEPYSLFDGDLKKKDLLLRKVGVLEEYWIENHAPSLFYQPTFPEGNNSCPSGYAIYDTAGEYNLEIPKGCRAVYVRAWGAGGGDGGGAGGFSMGVVDVPENARLSAVVGGAGKDGRGFGVVEGGFNGGGDGGLGSEVLNMTSGASGGGKTELKVNKASKIIAGGGGGGVHRHATYARGLPGGGRQSLSTNQIKKINSRYGIFEKRLQENNLCESINLSNTGSGASGAEAKKECSLPPGAGGGGGLIGGAGGFHGGAGHGGTGLAPEFGLTVWGVHSTPNSEDIYHMPFSGNSEKDGLLVVTWPAPRKDHFLKAIVKHQTDLTPYLKASKYDENKFHSNLKLPSGKYRSQKEREADIRDSLDAIQQSDSLSDQSVKELTALINRIEKERVSHKGDERRTFAYYRKQSYQNQLSRLRDNHNSRAPVGKRIQFYFAYDDIDTAVMKGKNLGVDGTYVGDIEIFDIQNNSENKLYLMMPGMAFSSEGFAAVKGDLGKDTVILDGCLNWFDTGYNQNNERRFFAIDDKYEYRRVYLENISTVVIPGKCDLNYLERRKKALQGLLSQD